MAGPYTITPTGVDWFNNPTQFGVAAPLSYDTTSALPSFAGMKAYTPPNPNDLFGIKGLGMDEARLGLAGIGTLGGLWGAFQQASLARKQFNYTKDITETNLANSMKQYNNGIVDRANNRAIVEGRDAGYTQSYIDRNTLSRYGR